MQLNANSPKFLLAVLILAGLSLVYTITATVPGNQTPTLSAVTPRTQLAQVSGSSCTTGDLTCGLVGWWKLDDGSGTTASDSSGSGNNGTISGSPLPGWTAGEIGGALGFSGGTGNIRVSSISLNTGTYTICTWENAPAIAAYETEAIGYRWPFQLYLTSVDGKTLRAMFSNNSGTYAHSGNDMAPNAWNHLCLIRNSDNTVSFYVNGALSGAANQFAGTTTAPMSAGYIIGGRADGTNVSAMTGSLDDYRIYNRALAPSEIQSLYSGATSGTGSTPTAPAISGVSISNVTSSGATVSWTTDIPADSQVLYGLTQNYGSQTAVDSTLVTSHSVQLTGLLSGTQYDFEVKSSASGLSSASGNNLLTTAAASTPVTPPPPPPPPPATSVDTGPLIGGIIDPSRAMDWSGAGIPGGIPHYTTICQTVAPSGLTDATDMNAIDSAIAACGAAYKSTGVGQVVQLQAGTYTVTNGLTFGPNTGVSGVVLRGAGPDQTKLVFTGSNPCNGTYSNICVMGSKGWGGNYLDFGGGSATWTGGYAKGSSVITVGSTAGLSVGQVIILDQRNDAIGIVASPNGASESGTTATITTSIPHGFKVGQCVGIGDVSGSYSTSGYNAAGNTSGSCGVYRGWVMVTAVYDTATGSFDTTSGFSDPASTKFQFTAPVAGLAPSGGGYVTAENGGVFVSNVHGAVIGEGSSQGRRCPDAADPSCLPGEISQRSQAELKRVVAINGDQITIDPPIEMNNWRASQAPGIWWTGPYVKYDGIEDLTYDMTSSGSEVGGILFVNAYDSWAKDVRGVNGGRNHIWLQNSARIDVRDSYFFGTHRGASQSYGVEAFSSSDNLIENNICQHVVSCLMNGQSYGTVFASNYAQDDGYYTTDWMAATISGNHDYAGMDLFEGNDADAINFDHIHGVSDDITTFRNRFVGQGMPIKPNTASLMVMLDGPFNRAMNFIGNIIGTPGYETNYQHDGLGFPESTIWALNQSGYAAATADPLVHSTLLRWGNYDTASGATQWNPAEIPDQAFTFINANPVPTSQALPASLYLSSAPAFWRTPWGTPPWPAIGPDVTGGTAPDGVAGHSYEIPSQLCYEHSPIDPSYQRSFTVTGASFYSPTDTVTLTIGANSFKVADTITVSGIVPSAYDGIFQVTAVTASTISYVPTSNPGAYTSGGTVTWPNIRDFNGATCYPGDFSGSNASTVPVTGTSGSGNSSGSTNGGTSSAGASTNSGAGGGALNSSGGGGGGGGASIGATANSAASNSPATNSPTTPCTSSPSAIPASALSLTIGTRGPDVTNLQTFLVIMGYLNRIYITGYFGALTKAALTAYQAAHPSTCGNTQAPSNNNQTSSNNQISPFTRSLKLGMTGNDVKNLQIFLNTHGFTVSQSGAGSSGHETTYFGPATFRAVIRFQNAYANQILAPYGLSQGTGFFGPSTMKEVNQLLSN